MNVLIVGATGTLGRQIARRALDEGHRVRCLVRSSRKASFLKEWGAELVPGDLCDPESLTAAMTDMNAVIDTATSRPADAIRDVDWQGKVSLIQATQSAEIERFIFFSVLGAENYPHVPLMEVKRCTEAFLAETSLKYTILKPCGFFQGLIGQYAIPILDKQTVWELENVSPMAYMDSQDVALFAVRALTLPETERKTFPVVGDHAWKNEEIIELCERLSEQEAKVTRISLSLLRATRAIARFFQWSWNVADRLAFAEVLASGKPLIAQMSEVYPVFHIDPQEMNTLENYLQEYFSRITQKIKEVEFEKKKAQERAQRRRSPFKVENRAK